MKDFYQRNCELVKNEKCRLSLGQAIRLNETQNAYVHCKTYIFKHHLLLISYNKWEFKKSSLFSEKYRGNSD